MVAYSFQTNFKIIFLLILMPYCSLIGTAFPVQLIFFPIYIGKKDNWVVACKAKS